MLISRNPPRIPHFQRSKSILSSLSSCFFPSEIQKDSSAEKEINNVLIALGNEETGGLLAKEQGKENFLLLKLNDLLLENASDMSDTFSKEIINFISYSFFQLSTDKSKLEQKKELLKALLTKIIEKQKETPSAKSPFANAGLFQPSASVSFLMILKKCIYQAYAHVEISPPTKKEQVIKYVYLQALKGAKPTRDRAQWIGYLAFALQTPSFTGDSKIPSSYVQVLSYLQKIHDNFSSMGDIKAFKNYVNSNARQDADFKEAVILYLENFTEIHFRDITLPRTHSNSITNEKISECFFPENFSFRPYSRRTSSDTPHTQKLAALRDCLALHRSVFRMRQTQSALYCAKNMKARTTQKRNALFHRSNAWTMHALSQLPYTDNVTLIRQIQRSLGEDIGKAVHEFAKDTKIDIKNPKLRTQPAKLKTIALGDGHANLISVLAQLVTKGILTIEDKTKYDELFTKITTNDYDKGSFQTLLTETFDVCDEKDCPTVQLLGDLVCDRFLANDCFMLEFFKFIKESTIKNKVHIFVGNHDLEFILRYHALIKNPQAIFKGNDIDRQQYASMLKTYEWAKQSQENLEHLQSLVEDYYFPHVTLFDIDAEQGFFYAHTSLTHKMFLGVLDAMKIEKNAPKTEVIKNINKKFRALVKEKKKINEFINQELTCEQVFNRNKQKIKFIFWVKKTDLDTKYKEICDTENGKIKEGEFSTPWNYIIVHGHALHTNEEFTDANKTLSITEYPHISLDSTYGKVSQIWVFEKHATKEEKEYISNLLWKKFQKDLQEWEKKHDIRDQESEYNQLKIFLGDQFKNRNSRLLQAEREDILKHLKKNIPDFPPLPLFDDIYRNLCSFDDPSEDISLVTPNMDPVIFSIPKNITNT